MVTRLNFRVKVTAFDCVVNFQGQRITFADEASSDFIIVGHRRGIGGQVNGVVVTDDPYADITASA